MFATRTAHLGTERPLPADFDALSLQVNEQGQITKQDSTEPFKYRISKHQRIVTLHLEATLKAIRNYIADRLAKHDIAPIFLDAELGISRVVPSKPHVPIFTSDLDRLRTKNAVIILCGEHDQEPTILTKLGVTGELGIDRGSILSVVAHLCAWRHIKDLQAGGHAISYASVTSGAFDTVLGEETTPGLIVLNPGQRIYSYQHNMTFTQDSWLARPMSSTQRKPFGINLELNFVQHHRTADEHVETFFRFVLPQLVNPEAKICLIGIHNGAQSILTALDKLFLQEPSHPLARQLAKTTLIASSHTHEDIQSEVLLNHLATSAIAWQLDESPKGTALGKPEDRIAPAAAAIDYTNIVDFATEAEHIHIGDAVAGENALSDEASSPLPILTTTYVHVPSHPITIDARPDQLFHQATTGRFKEISPLALRLQEARARGDSSSFASFDESRASTQEDISGSPSMESMDEYNRKQEAELPLISSFVQERITGWMVAEHGVLTGINEQSNAVDIADEEHGEVGNAASVEVTDTVTGVSFSAVDTQVSTQQQDGGSDRSDGQLSIATHHTRTAADADLPAPSADPPQAEDVDSLEKGAAASDDGHVVQPAL
ncbi:hypothetical protein AMS68_004839 [Peltaster fructicola]|uniref:Arb2 domain-containing protein n=1 Tax=Peltaster fructicola TaxID=286661 RepID=A0A6H0XX21_9PEZI|nr:hypothetical protein AMS68_004839 [Peltaster fructicola]